MVQSSSLQTRHSYWIPDLWLVSLKKKLRFILLHFKHLNINRLTAWRTPLYKVILVLLLVFFKICICLLERHSGKRGRDREKSSVYWVTHRMVSTTRAKPAWSHEWGTPRCQDSNQHADMGCSIASSCSTPGATMLDPDTWKLNHTQHTSGADNPGGMRSHY